MSAPARRVADVDVAAALRSADGLRVVTGPFVVRMRSPLPAVARAVQQLYQGFPLAAPDDFIDFDVAVRRPAGLRRWWHPQVVFEFSGEAPFNPLPGDQGFPLLEWGMNWCIYAMCHQYLIIHAAVLERGGGAVILPAPSGSGKSTLCAGLGWSGWRLLSDELTLLSPEGRVTPLPRPVSLKNESIDVIERFAPQVRFGSRVHETAKGTVAHFAPPADALARAAEMATPRWVVLPRYAPGTQTRLEPIDRAEAFMELVENAFNYPVFGAEGFELLGRVLDGCRCFRLGYSRLAEATATLSSLADHDLPSIA